LGLRRERSRGSGLGRGFVVRDLPWTEAQLRKIPPFEFENWAVIAIGGIPNKAQVGDQGIDGRIYPVAALPSVRSAAFRPSPNGLKPALQTQDGLKPALQTQDGLKPALQTQDGLKPALQTDLGFMDLWYPIQVKQKDKVGRPDIDSFEAVMMREERPKGFFVAFDSSQDALDEIGRFFKQTGKAIVALTVKEILDEQIAMKLV